MSLFRLTQHRLHTSWREDGSLSRACREKPLLTNEECAKAEDMGNFYRVPADNRTLNYDKYFKEGEAERNTLTEFNSNNTRILDVQETMDKIVALEYIKKELSGEGKFVQ